MMALIAEMGANNSHLNQSKKTKNKQNHETFTKKHYFILSR